MRLSPLLRVVLAAGLCIASSDAAVRLPALISDHMLLQRDVPVRIWGWADAGEAVEVRFRGQSKATTASSDGNWQVFLDPMHAGGPDRLTVEATNRLAIEDVLVGEVWVASGQSNMQWTVAKSNDAQAEISSADYPHIRLFQVPQTVANQPKDDVEGAWKICSPEAVEEFSAVGYFFARQLHKDLGVPFGIVQSAWGGTPAEAWTRKEYLAAEPSLHVLGTEWQSVLDGYAPAKQRFDRALADWQMRAAGARKAGRPVPNRPRTPRGPGHQHTPSGLYNAMIAPLTPYAIRGAIWYQGENNAGRAQGYLYRRLFQTMIQNWRDDWGVGEFPFLFVQLANYARVSDTAEWPETREAQALALRMANTGMAVTIDIGDAADIHPRNKQDVGYRLSLAARKIAYGHDIVYSGPVYRQATVEGNAMRVWFDHVAGGLKTSGPGQLEGFEVAGADGKYQPATAKIHGDTVVVSSLAVRAPVAVRYAWANDPAGNLYNASGLPASPFRSQDPSTR